MLCTTFTVSSSAGFTVTLVRVSGRRAPTAVSRGFAAHFRSVLRHLCGASANAAPTSPADGTAPSESLGDASAGAVVRPCPPPLSAPERAEFPLPPPRWLC